ncbi:hypothetical protein BO78DRAFT_385458 [Aspergillus sclerotiicarbonarius CBS 121057]|uniref:hydroxymethylglutaryl-CoA reductase (NADPH) n=1 Tax=Aspergillus sclerotiicarbonarius (strain CBS 121057 / IBT 28362) TaxID=1448318 RepID=A0A319ECU9_ASPSB|nr:hypothetical protein BO78DRAFT_385458 [Aspergillus sclerotiicarbonarius CBS 121057]
MVQEGSIRNGQHGSNINVANVLAAIFIATGQDAASITDACWAHLTPEYDYKSQRLTLSLYFPSLPVGVVGGGTVYATQREALRIMQCDGPGGKHQLAGYIAAFALALEVISSLSPPRLLLLLPPTHTTLPLGNPRSALTAEQCLQRAPYPAPTDLPRPSSPMPDLSTSPGRDPDSDPREDSNNNNNNNENNNHILSQHLHPQFTASLQDELVVPPGDAPAEQSSGDAPSEPQSSLKLQGGDIHRDLYRIDAKSKQARLDKRAATFSFLPRHADDVVEEGVASLEPGSFRRHFIQNKYGRLDQPGVTSSFLDFLDIYGNFAGEDLADTEEESAIIDEEDERQVSERTALLQRRKSLRASRPGDASNVKTFFTLLKAFVGTGIIFLPKAFRNGGILFSSITLVTVALISTLCFHLLLECRRHYGGGYGDIGERIGGPRLRTLILASIVISQLGFVCACIIFTAENIHAFVEAVTKDQTTAVSIGGLIALQLLVLIPLSLIRNISKLGPIALLADVFILVGLAYIYCYDIASLASRGLASTVELFNRQSFTLTIGSCIFTFEGIGLILPIQSSMKRPEHFDKLLYTVMAIITVLFTAVGALSYATFGEETKTEIISNLPRTDRFVNALQFFYSLAILVSTPIQLFPAVRILEGKLFGQGSGKRDPLIKWKKNVFRTGAVVGCGLIAAVGAGDLDKFVSLIGSFACVPLVYIYPAYLHWNGVAESAWAKRGDIAMMVLGVVFMVYTTSATVSVWLEGSP